MPRMVIVLAALGIMGGGAIPALAGVIQNGGFEEGDIPENGGSLSPIPNWGGNETFATDDSDFPHGGFGPHIPSLAYAAFGAIGELDSISQIIGTNVGQVYELEYWFASDGNTNEFKVTWDNTVLFDETNIHQHGYQHYSFFVTGTGGNTLAFAGRDDGDSGNPENFGYLSLDDVSLTAVPDTAAVPEPGSLAIFAIGAVTMLGWHWRRRRPKSTC